MTTYSEEVYWLALINQAGLKLNLIKPIIQRWCINDKRALGDLLELSALELSSTFGLGEGEAEQILSVSDKLANQAEAVARWREAGLEVIILTDPRYPRRLIYSLPPAKHPLVLWVQGSTDLLGLPGVTMLGQEPSDEETSSFINDLLLALQREGVGLVSGYARGLDRLTFEQILTTESGQAVAILPMGLSAFGQTTSKLDPAVQSGRAVLVSPFAPDTRFDERLAEARNILIDHIILALLIPESDEEALPRAQAALERGQTVLVKNNTPGNRTLIEEGALLLTDPGEVLECVEQALLDLALQEDEEEELFDKAVPSAPATPPSGDPLGAAPLSVTAPSEPELSDDDYSLRAEEVPPMDSEEALEVLSLGGDIPPVLRNRLKQRAETEEDEEE